MRHIDRSDSEARLRAVEEAPVCVSEEERADLLTFYGDELHDAGRGQEALAAWGAARDLFERRGIVSRIADCDYSMGMTLLCLGQLAEARVHAEAALAQFETEAGRELEVALAKSLTARCRLIMGDDSARTMLEEARDALIELRPRAAAEIDEFLGEWLLCKHQIYDAIPALSDAARRFREIGEVDKSASLRLHIADELLELRYIDQALKEYRMARREFQQAGALDDVPLTDLGGGYCLAALDKLPGALKMYRRAERALKKQGRQFELADAQQSIGLLLKELGRYEDAAKKLREAAQRYFELRMPEERVMCIAEVAHMSIEGKIEPISRGEGSKTCPPDRT